MGKDEMEFVTWMSRLAREDRELYRELRQEAWDMVQRNHAQHTSEQRSRWLGNAS
jgi:hypothetical protein